MNQSRLDFDRRFLLRLAAVWLACRARVFGHGLTGEFPKPDLAFDLLGMNDHRLAMALECEAVLGRSDTRRAVIAAMEGK